jgi:type IV secretion system protein VirB10
MSPADRRQQGEPSCPDLPQVTRLNRNVLLVAGMGVGVVVLAITHVVRSDGRPAAVAAGTGAVESPAVASFLQQPPQRGAGTVPIPPPAYPGSGQGTDPAALDSPETSAAGPESGATIASYDPYSASYSARSAPPQPSRRAQAYQRALRAGLRARDLDATSTSATNPTAAIDAYAVPENASTDAVPTQRFAAGADARPNAAARPQTRHEAFLSGVAEQRDPAIYIPTRVQTPISEYQIMAGTVLPAMLVTEISSDLPGEILAQVSRNIYDAQQKYLLIPRGTRVIGRYDSQVALGQSRVLIAWTRLIFPDGRSLALPGLPTQDLRGAAGIRSRVNNHTGRLYGQAILLSIMGAGAQLSQPRTSSVLAPPSAGQVAAGALGQELSQVSMETIRRNMDVRPTLQVRAGTPFSIFLERDLVLEGPYTDVR